ncbi:MAG: bifunctional phosphoribosylaminoimidazolecarboxamide formyltransferase/inosine monophosphate cyclohydrolase [Legionellales bacterium]|nr:bifunctional phosphoribosylaminoimidazolecarboxamide formyltransferase/inosine monophosphate cyclohydrolase [Legionellales bacterium]
MSQSQKQRAIISVSDKSNLLEFATFLHHQQIELYSTGGTAKILKQHNIPVIEVADYTQFPEIMDGRVKTLHPKIYAGILRRDQDTPLLQDFEIKTFDFVIVNLYPFSKTIANPEALLKDKIEHIDIGGPCMLRAAAKNYNKVTVICDPSDYQLIQSELETAQTISLASRQKLMTKAFAHTAAYDATVANHFQKTFNQNDYPQQLTLTFNKQQDLRYGENPSQNAAFYQDINTTKTFANYQQLQGKALSYNNIADADAALACVRAFQQTACVIVKHANPCGVAVADSCHDAYLKAFKTDPTSAFGGIIAFNHLVDKITAKAIIEQQFVEVIVAPFFANEALQIFSQKPNIRILSLGYDLQTQQPEYMLKKVDGGLLIQDTDILNYDKNTLKIVTERQPNAQEYQDLLFAWSVVKYVKSNAIVYAKDNMTIGIGAGQMSRIYSAKIANIKAQDENLTVSGSVMASDAFFPFRDSIDAAQSAGITAIIQPGGSIRDQEVVSAANEAKIAMIFTGLRHFLH